MFKSKHVLALYLSLLYVSVNAQNHGLEYSLDLSQTSAENEVILTWSGVHSNPTAISRKLYKEKNWTVLEDSVLNNRFVDSTALEGFVYEYRVEMDNSTTPEALYNSAFGYTTADLRVELDWQRKGILVLVDSALSTEIENDLLNLKYDLILDGFNPHIELVSPQLELTEIKTIVTDYYYQKNIAYVYLIGHIEVPYSGFHAPDGHQDHLGAWPADGYYGDVNNESWTEFPLFDIENERDPRNSNNGSDGKFDQNVFPTELELVVSRIDFSNLPCFSDSEAALTREYLSRARSWKRGLISTNNKGLIQDSLMHEVEGFGNNFYRNLNPILGNNNLESGLYIDALSNANYLFAQGTSYANDTAAYSIGSSHDLAETPTNAVFKMLTGSYFGDWDTRNNFLRSNLASGTTLNVIWTGRPNYFLHGLAANYTIGETFKRNCNNGIGSSTKYEPKGSAVNNTSMALFGDPTIRLNQKQAITNATIEVKDSVLVLSWQSNPGLNITQFVISKYNKDKERYEIVARIDQPQSFYLDFLSRSGTHSYIVNAVFIEDEFQVEYLNSSYGYIIEKEIDLNQANRKLYPTNLSLKPNQIDANFYEFEVSYVANDTGNYVVSLEHNSDGFWQEVGATNKVKGNLVPSSSIVYFYDSLSFNVANKYRAVCRFADSLFYSDDTSLLVTFDENISLYPIPLVDNRLFVLGYYGTAELDYSVFNSEGKLQSVPFNVSTMSFDFSGMRKGLYLIRIGESLFKVPVLH